MLHVEGKGGQCLEAAFEEIASYFLPYRDNRYVTYGHVRVSGTVPPKVKGSAPESQAQNLALTVLYGPCSLDSGREQPQKALGGGIPSSFLEPSPRSWSHFVGIYRQKLTKSSKNDF